MLLIASRKNIYQMMNLNGPNKIAHRKKKSRTSDLENEKPKEKKNAFDTSGFFQAEPTSDEVEKKELSMWHSPSHIKKACEKEFLEWEEKWI